MTIISRGLRNNNPGNIRINNDVFQGEIKPSQDTSFKQFKTMAYGYRAVFVILSNYLLKYDLDTISKIITRWAPPNENNTQAYIKNVSKWSGIPEHKKLTVYSGKDYIKIVAAMSRVENGVQADLTDLKSGFEKQDRIK